MQVANPLLFLGVGHPVVRSLPSLESSLKTASYLAKCSQNIHTPYIYPNFYFIQTGALFLTVMLLVGEY